MNLRGTVSAHALSFAHLTGLARPTAKTKADDEDADKMTKRDDETDDEFAERKRKAKAAQKKDEDEDPDDEPEDGDDDEGVDAEDKDKDTDLPEDKKSKKRARASARRAYAKGRTAERARCAAIFASEHASGRVELAARLAFATDMTAAAAIGVLEASPKASRAALADRMAQLPPEQIRVPVGGPEAPKGDAIAALWDRAMLPYRPAGARS